MRQRVPYQEIQPDLRMGHHLRRPLATHAPPRVRAPMPKKKHPKTTSKNWERYQEQAAEFFRSLGCDADVNLKKVPGARGKHDIDVLVRFKKFGLETTWVIECKYWKSRVPKEKVEALKFIVDDVGADRGILISTVGFQSGAFQVANNSNITLTTLDLLKETARQDLVLSALHGLETKLVNVKDGLHDLYSIEQTSEYSLLSKPRPGVDGAAVSRVIACLSVLKDGFDAVRAGKSPYPVGFDDNGQAIVSVTTLDAFVAQATKVIGEAETTLGANSPLNT